MFTINGSNCIARYTNRNNQTQNWFSEKRWRKATNTFPWNEQHREIEQKILDRDSLSRIIENRYWDDTDPVDESVIEFSRRSIHRKLRTIERAVSRNRNPSRKSENFHYSFGGKKNIYATAFFPDFVIRSANLHNGRR